MSRWVEVEGAHATRFQLSEETQMDLIFKLPVLLLLGFIVFSLAQGMYYLAKDDGEMDKTRVVRALTIRIVLSLTLFGLLILGYALGLIEPHAV
jgi:hypothetical protein